MPQIKALLLLLVVTTFVGCGQAISFSDTAPADTGKNTEKPGDNPQVVDTDNDGVADNQDSCSNTPANETANANGCSWAQQDADNDGVNNEIDECSNTPANASVNNKGCELNETPDPQPVDTDNDGVADNQDSCPNTPAGKSVNNNGCSWAQQDADNDDILNGSDKCQQTEAGMSVNNDGCAANQLDADNDSVTDDKDNCPNTPAGKRVDTNGCEIVVEPSGNDADGDGVDDAVDQCAYTPEEYITDGLVDDDGCKDIGPDADNDNVTDADDQCPGTSYTELSDETGCSASQRDLDRDGYTDDVDLCLATPSGEEVDVNGCGTATQQSSHEVVFLEDFESFEVGDKHPLIYKSFEKVVDNCGDGRDQCLRLEYIPYDRGTDRVSSKLIYMDRPGTHYSLHYDILFEEGFEFVRGGKLPGLASYESISGCAEQVPNKWSVRMMWRPEGSAQAYHYSQQRVERCGDGGRTRPGVFKIGQWQKIRLEVKLNSEADNFDGHIRLFIDGVLEVQHEGMQFRKEITEATEISQLYFSTFYGGSDTTWAPSKTTYIRFDNFKVTDHDS